MKYNIDLHSHSFWSDGDASPQELAARAHEAGIDCLVLTDHASVGGSESFVECCNKFGIQTINGVELTCKIGLIWFDVLVYNFANQDQLMVDLMERNQVALKIVCEKYISYLQGIKMPIQWKAILEYFNLPHGIVPSLYLVNKYRRLVLFHEQQEINGDIRRAGMRQIDRADIYLSNLPKLTEVVEVSKKNGALVSLAHPIKTANFISRLTGTEFECCISELFTIVEQNRIMAVEVSHPTNPASREGKVAEFCKRNNLIVTGGSDYHGDKAGEHKENVHFGQYGLRRKEYAAMMEYLNSLKAADT